jgi:hypothetical protein
MASKTQIANRALSKVGEQRVSNVDTDNVKAAKVISSMWDIIRDAMLTAYPWNFAVTRTQLAKDATSPAWGYQNRYALPSDFLSLLEVRYNSEYTIETDSVTGGLYILTDEDAPLYIKYIKRVTNTGEFDPLFVEALATRLAFEACEELTQSNTKKQVLFEELRINIKEAYASDSIQEAPVLRQQDEWLLSRESSIDDIDYNLNI